MKLRTLMCNLLGHRNTVADISGPKFNKAEEWWHLDYYDATIACLRCGEVRDVRFEYDWVDRRTGERVPMMDYEILTAAKTLARIDRQDKANIEEGRP